MSRTHRRRGAAVTAMAGTLALTTIAAAGAAPAPVIQTGPSSSLKPYVIPVAGGVRITSLLTVGDAPEGYRMVGIPDALGASPGRQGTIDVLMNHELRSSQGVTRAHGKLGAFVSRWTLDPRTGAVSGGSDLITQVIDWDYISGTYETNTDANSAFYRLCSGSLTEAGQLVNRRSGNGYPGRIYFANEEGEQVRTFGVTMDGTAYQLPRMGRLPSENTIVAPTRGDRTVVVANEDGNKNTSQLRVYWGTKTDTGSPVDRAGLTNGVLNVLKVAGVSDDEGFRATYGKGNPAPVTFGELDWTLSPDGQTTSGLSSGALGFTRIEDGNFDPRKPNTTEGGNTTPDPGTGYTRDGGGLWRLRFADVNKPELGATNLPLEEDVAATRPADPFPSELVERFLGFGRPGQGRSAGSRCLGPDRAPRHARSPRVTWCDVGHMSGSLRIDRCRSSTRRSSRPTGWPRARRAR